MPKAARLRRSPPAARRPTALLHAALLATTALAAGAAAPALAHDDGPRVEDEGDLSRRLSDPMTQAGVAAAASAAIGALLSVDISPLAKAMGAIDGGARDLPPGTTLGDIAGRDARDLPHDIARRTPQAMGALAGMVGSMEAMRPQFEAMGRSLRRQMRLPSGEDLPEE